ncbi:hypothetical protein ABT025_18950 [Streptomyces sp. NPDC002809]|uniref:hypothetical protein n=1 Tax=Streptomyces sp. NPDC002809 TaxID=3154433 RepID=UPI00332E5E67
MTDIGVTLAQLQKRIDRLERASRLSYAALDDTALEVRDGAGSLRGIVGQQGDGTTAVNVVNGPPPPQPSAPIVVSVLGGVTVSWDGLFADGAVMPLDWSRVEVHASTLAVYTPTAASLKATVETAQGCTVVIATTAAVYVQLVARSTSGTASPPSATVGPVGPTAVVASDILDGIVTTVKLADDAVTQAKVAVGAIGATEISDNAITTPKIVAGAVQTAQLDALAVNASKIAAGAVTTAKLAALAVTANELAANTITAGKLAAGSVDATALKADAITGKTITGGSIVGATVTGAIVRTGTTGPRLLMGPDAGGTGVPGLALYSGASAETSPGLLWSTVLTGTPTQPMTVVQAPYVDSGSARLDLTSPASGSGGQFKIATSTTNDYAYFKGKDGSTAGASLLELWAQNGTSGGSSVLQVKGTEIYMRSDAITANGIFAAGNIAWGTINVTTTAANTVGSATITGLNVAGSTFRIFVTGSSGAPGTQLLGVSGNNVTSGGATVYVTRTNATTTGVYWLIVGI